MLSCAEASVTAGGGKAMLTPVQNVFVNDFNSSYVYVLSRGNKTCLWFKYLIKEQMLLHDFRDHV